jgi:hypothetical protein
MMWTFAVLRGREPYSAFVFARQAWLIRHVEKALLERPLTSGCRSVDVLTLSSAIDDQSAPLNASFSAMSNGSRRKQRIDPAVAAIVHEIRKPHQQWPRADSLPTDRLRAAGGSTRGERKMSDYESWDDRYEDDWGDQGQRLVKLLQNNAPQLVPGGEKFVEGGAVGKHILPLLGGGWLVADCYAYIGIGALDAYIHFGANDRADWDRSGEAEDRRVVEVGRAVRRLSFGHQGGVVRSGRLGLRAHCLCA